MANACRLRQRVDRRKPVRRSRPCRSPVIQTFGKRFRDLDWRGRMVDENLVGRCALSAIPPLPKTAASRVLPCVMTQTWVISDAARGVSRRRRWDDAMGFGLTDFFWEPVVSHDLMARSGKAFRESLPHQAKPNEPYGWLVAGHSSSSFAAFSIEAQCVCRRYPTKKMWIDGTSAVTDDARKAIGC